MSLGSIGGSQGFLPSSGVKNVGGITNAARTTQTASVSSPILKPMGHDTFSFATASSLGLEPSPRFGGLSPTTSATLENNEAGLQAASQPQPGVRDLAAGLRLSPEALGFSS